MSGNKMMSVFEKNLAENIEKEKQSARPSRVKKSSAMASVFEKKEEEAQDNKRPRQSTKKQKSEMNPFEVKEQESEKPLPKRSFKPVKKTEEQILKEKMMAEMFNKMNSGASREPKIDLEVTDPFRQQEFKQWELPSLSKFNRKPSVSRKKLEQ